jgi:hypothetical protein
MKKKERGKGKGKGTYSAIVGEYVAVDDVRAEQVVNRFSFASKCVGEVGIPVDQVGAGDGWTYAAERIIYLAKVVVFDFVQKEAEIVLRIDLILQ